MRYLIIVLLYSFLGSFGYVCVNAAFLKIFCGSFSNSSSTELEKPLPLINGSTCYNPSLPSMFYTFGFSGKASEQDSMTIIGVYLDTIKYNVFLIDWEQEAAAILMAPIGYFLHAAPNAVVVGKQCGEALITMAEQEFNLDTVHLIGHSLGAHLMGYCGKEVQKHNKNLTHITGLDPAGPLFEGIASFHGLDSSSAIFVDILHTNPRYLGNYENLGTVDIWFNYVNGSQPGCFERVTLIDKVTNTSSSCAHQRAWMYYAEAVADPTAYLARKAESYEKWRTTNATSSSKIIHVGETISRCARNNYYLSTEASAPYGRGKRGLNP